MRCPPNRVNPTLRVTAASYVLAKGKTASEAWRYGVEHVQSPRCFADDQVFYERSISGHELGSVPCVRAHKISPLELGKQKARLLPNPSQKQPLQKLGAHQP